MVGKHKGRLPAPLQVGTVFVGSGFRGSFSRPSKRMDAATSRNDSVSWAVDRDTPDIASPPVGNRLYFHKGKTGLLTCLDAKTGDPHYSTMRIPGIRSTYSSPVAAGGHVYVTGRGGTTVVLKDGENFEIVASNTVGEPVDTTPAPVGKELFIRGKNHLFCFGVTQHSSCFGIHSMRCGEHLARVTYH